MKRKVPIKFRGRMANGKLVSGDAVHDDAGILIYDGNYHRVEEDSVRQLVGYAKGNVEVYERDELFEDWTTNLGRRFFAPELGLANNFLEYLKCCEVVGNEID